MDTTPRQLSQWREEAPFSLSSFPFLCWCSRVLGCCCMRRRMTSALAALQKICPSWKAVESQCQLKFFLSHSLSLFLCLSKLCVPPLQCGDMISLVVCLQEEKNKNQLFKEISAKRRHSNKVERSRTLIEEMTSTNDKYSLKKQTNKKCFAQKISDIISPGFPPFDKQKDHFHTWYLSKWFAGLNIFCSVHLQSATTGPSGGARDFMDAHSLSCTAKKYPNYYGPHIYDVLLLRK